MNAKHLIAAVTVLATTGGSAIAQEYVVPDANFVSPKTRAEVVAELDQARADGSLNVHDNAYPVIPLTGTPRTRAEVVAEFDQARADGSLNVHDNAYPVIPLTDTPRTRAEVVAELDQARTDGSLEFKDPDYPNVRASGTSKTIVSAARGRATLR